MLKWRFNPLLRARALAMLSDRFESEVEIRDFNASLLPLGVDGGGLVLRLHGRKDVPPLITIQKFHADASLLGIWRWHIRQVKVEGMRIQVPPREKEPEDAQAKGRKREIKVSVDEFISENTELVIIPRNPEKDPHVFEIHHLVMHGLGLGRSASFTTSLTNATPPGEIH